MIEQWIVCDRRHGKLFKSLIDKVHSIGFIPDWKYVGYDVNQKYIDTAEKRVTPSKS